MAITFKQYNVGKNGFTQKKNYSLIIDFLP